MNHAIDDDEAEVIPTIVAELTEYLDVKIDAYNKMDSRKRKEKAAERDRLNDLILQLNTKVGFKCYNKLA